LKNAFAGTMLESFCSGDRLLVRLLQQRWRLRLADVAFILEKSVTEGMERTVIQYMYMLI
jgi:hypothetical protein